MKRVTIIFCLIGMVLALSCKRDTEPGLPSSVVKPPPKDTVEIKPGLKLPFPGKDSKGDFLPIVCDSFRVIDSLIYGPWVLCRERTTLIFPDDTNANELNELFPPFAVDTLVFYKDGVLDYDNFLPYERIYRHIYHTKGEIIVRNDSILLFYEDRTGSFSYGKINRFQNDTIVLRTTGLTGKADYQITKVTYSTYVRCR